MFVWVNTTNTTNTKYEPDHRMQLNDTYKVYKYTYKEFVKKYEGFYIHK